jgi:hypothetical protein
MTMPMDYLSEMELDRAVLFVLHQHVGKDNAIERWSLDEKIFGADVAIEPLRNNNNIYDRQVRDSIERWRSQGQHICNMGAGYFVAKTRDEYNAFKAKYLSAAYKQLQNASMMDMTADDRWGAVPKPVSVMQVSMFGGG